MVEWNPIGLKALYNGDERNSLLQESIWNYKEQPEQLKPIIKAGLKYLPNELGTLLFTIEDNNSPYELLMDRKEGWAIIEESFEEVEGFNLNEPDTDTSLYPFMVAACDQSCPCVDLVYYLLRKDPCVLLQAFNPVCNEERRLEEGTSRKRKTM